MSTYDLSLYMGILKEFKKFAVKGNMIDMAVGIVIGAAFTTVVKSMVDDIIMPIVGQLTGGVDFSQLFFVMDGGQYESLAAAQEVGAATINYGLFINSLVAFLIVAWVLFIIVKAMNKMKPEPIPVQVITKECLECLMTIPKAAKKCAHATIETH